MVFLACVLASGALSASPTAQPAHQAAAAVVARIRAADYEGDRTALRRLAPELDPYRREPFGSRVLYWQGFAFWRRAINGFNETVDPKEQDADLKQAIVDFDAAIAKDPKFADAKIGKLSCVGLVAFLHRSEPGAFQAAMPAIRALVDDLKTTAPDNPRFVWVHGQNVWNIPPERGGGQDRAIEMYRKALEDIRKQPKPSDDLEPAWGEPELLMSLAYSYEYKTIPNLDAAEKSATEALKLVPHWHYTRDILLASILDAKAKSGK